jgi:hypothetical protein
MNKASLIFVGTLLSMGSMLAASAGCGGGGGGGGGGTGGDNTGGNPSSSSSTTGSGGSSSSSGTGGSAPAATCDAYCTEIMANCTAANQQYADAAQCKAACASFPQGKPGDMSGHSLECRAYHATAAKAGAATHCHHAGISGGDQNPKDTTAGACGDGCDAFCDLVFVTCTGLNDTHMWAGDKNKCITDCRTFPATADMANTFDVGDTFEESFNCHLYHLLATIADPDMHCSHAIEPGLFCKPPP